MTGHDHKSLTQPHLAMRATLRHFEHDTTILCLLAKLLEKFGPLRGLSLPDATDNVARKRLPRIVSHGLTVRSQDL